MFFIHRNHLLLQEYTRTMADLTAVIAQLSSDVQANTTAVNAAAALIKNPPVGASPEQLAQLEAVATQMEANTKVLNDAMVVVSP